MVSRKQLTIGAAVVVGVGLVFAIQNWRSQSVTVEVLSNRESRQIWKADRSPAAGEWQRRYRFRREISATSGAKSILKFDLRGTLDLARQGAWVRARFQLDKSKEHPEIKSSIPFYFTMDTAGEITEIRSSGDSDQQSILKDLALLFAYRTRIDTAGEVEMKFRDSEMDGVAEILKQKLQYAGRIGKLVKIKKSEHRIRKDLSLLAGVEVTEMGEIETSSKYQLKLERIDLNVTDKINPALVSQYAKLPLLQGDGLADGSDGRPTISWKVLKAQLARIGKSSSAHRMKLFHEFIRTLRSDPQAMSEFKDWMSLRRGEGREGHRDFAYGIGVLSGVGTPSAQAELVRFHGEHSDAAIINSFATMAQPMTSETRDFLRALSESKRESESVPALLALGSSLRPRDGSQSIDVDREPAGGAAKSAGGAGSGANGAGAGAADEENVVALILAKYRAATQMSERMDVLDAMGNSGSDRFLPLLTSIIRDIRNPNMLVTKAIFAMRMMKSLEARTFLDRLASDEAYLTYRAVILSSLNHLSSRGLL